MDIKLPDTHVNAFRTNIIEHITEIIKFKDSKNNIKLRKYFQQPLNLILLAVLAKLKSDVENSDIHRVRRMCGTFIKHVQQSYDDNVPLVTHIKNRNEKFFVNNKTVLGLIEDPSIAKIIKVMWTDVLDNDDKNLMWDYTTCYIDILSL